MSSFIFNGYGYENGLATFVYSFDDGRTFVEKVKFQHVDGYDEGLLDRALFLAFIIIGTSYFKTFPTTNVQLLVGQIDDWQANFFNKVYQEGLSQFAFENDLNRHDLAQFKPSLEVVPLATMRYAGSGKLVLQSGGKDSLLTASLLSRNHTAFTPWYVSSSQSYPEVLGQLGEDLVINLRQLDHEALKKAAEDGGRNGHVPVTYIVQSLAVIQAILLNKNAILASIGHEGEEAHSWIGDLPVNHQWSKTWPAEQLFSEYVSRYISPDIMVGSPLRRFSELRISELFVEHAAQKYWNSFSSCNIGNYQQGASNSTLKWCGDCPKCANSYLLFAPFVEAEKLKEIFNNEDLFEKVSLQETFKGLLAIDNIKKPFECVGEVDELRSAYQMTVDRPGYGRLSFAVPIVDYDYNLRYPSQDIPL